MENPLNRQIIAMWFPLVKPSFPTEEQRLYQISEKIKQRSEQATPVTPLDVTLTPRDKGVVLLYRNVPWNRGCVLR